MINDVYFQGKKVLKSINLAEIYVPYAPGSPRPEDFSLGGFLANPMPLQIGRDCNSAGTGCWPFNRDGMPAVGSTADVMMHEEPIGFLYAGTQGRALGRTVAFWFVPEIFSLPSIAQVNFLTQHQTTAECFRRLRAI